MPTINNNGNGTFPRGLPKGNEEATLNRRREMLEDLLYNVMSNRRDFLNQLMDPRRNLERECGWPSLTSNINAHFYRQLYDFDPLAARVVQLMPRECFQVQPSVYETDDLDDKTPFEEAVDALNESLSEGPSWFREEKGSRLWEYIRRADELSGIGSFGIILIGIDDGLDLSMPVEGVVTTVGETEYKDSPPQREEVDKLKSLPNLNAHEQFIINKIDKDRGLNTDKTSPSEGAYSSGGELFGQHPMGTDQQYFGVQFGQSEQMGDKPSKKQHKLLYLRAFDESLVQIVRWESNPTNPRFGKPVMYRVTLNDPRYSYTGVGLPLATVFVHWSRVIHLADNLGSSEVMGCPRMQPVIGSILDARKVRGAGAEGYWRSGFTGLQFSTHPQLGGDVDVNIQELRDTAENYNNSLQRDLIGVGGTWSTVAPNVSDPTPHHNLAIETICIQLGCPVRVFKGAERGELASSQDDADWNGRVEGRQWGYDTPRIIIPLFDRLIMMGVLPEPCQESKDIAAKMKGQTYNVRRTRKIWVSNDDPRPAIPKSPTHQQPVDEEMVDDIENIPDKELPNPGMKQVEVMEESLAMKTARGYTIEWPKLDSLSQMDKAKYAQTMVASLAAYVSGGCEAVVPRKEYFVHYEGRSEEEAEALVCAADEEAARHEEEAATQAAKQGLEVDPNDPTKVVDPDALPPGVSEVDEDGNPLPPKPPGLAGPPEHAMPKGGPPQPPFGGGGFPPKKGPPKPPIGNANPEGCNQHTGPGCSRSEHDDGRVVTITGTKVLLRKGESIITKSKEVARAKKEGRPIPDEVKEKQSDMTPQEREKVESEAADWLMKWRSATKSGIPADLPSDDALKVIQESRPDKPIELSRWQQVDYDDTKRQMGNLPLQSWTTEHEVAKQTVEDLNDDPRYKGPKQVLLRKTFQPEDVIADFSKLPKGLVDKIKKLQGSDYDPGKELGEVLVRYNPQDKRPPKPPVSNNLEVTNQDIDNLLYEVGAWTRADNSNPEGCNQHTGPNCAGTTGDEEESSSPKEVEREHEDERISATRDKEDEDRVLKHIKEDDIRERQHDKETESIAKKRSKLDDAINRRREKQEEKIWDEHSQELADIDTKATKGSISESAADKMSTESEAKATAKIETLKELWKEEDQARERRYAHQDRERQKKRDNEDIEIEVQREKEREEIHTRRQAEDNSRYNS